MDMEYFVKHVNTLSNKVKEKKVGWKLVDSNKKVLGSIKMTTNGENLVDVDKEKNLAPSELYVLVVREYPPGSFTGIDKIQGTVTLGDVVKDKTGEDGTPVYYAKYKSVKALTLTNRKMSLSNKGGNLEGNISADKKEKKLSEAYYIVASTTFNNWTVSNSGGKIGFLWEVADGKDKIEDNMQKVSVVKDENLDTNRDYYYRDKDGYIYSFKLKEISSSFRKGEKAGDDVKKGKKIYTIEGDTVNILVKGKEQMDKTMVSALVSKLNSVKELNVKGLCDSYGDLLDSVRIFWSGDITVIDYNGHNIPQNTWIVARNENNGMDFANDILGTLKDQNGNDVKNKKDLNLGGEYYYHCKGKKDKKLLKFKLTGIKLQKDSKINSSLLEEGAEIYTAKPDWADEEAEASQEVPQQEEAPAGAPPAPAGAPPAPAGAPPAPAGAPPAPAQKAPAMQKAVKRKENKLSEKERAFLKKAGAEVGELSPKESGYKFVTTSGTNGAKTQYVNELKEALENREKKNSNKVGLGKPKDVKNPQINAGEVGVLGKTNLKPVVKQVVEQPVKGEKSETQVKGVKAKKELFEKGSAPKNVVKPAGVKPVAAQPVEKAKKEENKQQEPVVPAAQPVEKAKEENQQVAPEAQPVEKAEEVENKQQEPVAPVEQEKVCVGSDKDRIRDIKSIIKKYNDFSNDAEKSKKIKKKYKLSYSETLDLYTVQENIYKLWEAVLNANKGSHEENKKIGEEKDKLNMRDSRAKVRVARYGIALKDYGKASDNRLKKKLNNSLKKEWGELTKIYNSELDAIQRELSKFWKNLHAFKKFFTSLIPTFSVSKKTVRKCFKGAGKYFVKPDGGEFTLNALGNNFKDMNKGASEWVKNLNKVLNENGIKQCCGEGVNNESAALAAVFISIMGLKNSELIIEAAEGLCEGIKGDISIKGGAIKIKKEEVQKLCKSIGKSNLQELKKAPDNSLGKIIRDGVIETLKLISDPEYKNIKRMMGLSSHGSTDLKEVK